MQPAEIFSSISQPGWNGTIAHRRRIPELDGLRGIAILLVLAWHIVPAALVNAPHEVVRVVNFAIRFSWSGVDLFFVLSGFLLGGMLMDNRHSPHYFATFYARRAYRILPAYLVLVAAFFMLRPFAGEAQHTPLFARPMPLASYLTFTQNFAMAHRGFLGAQWLGPTWSLSVEEQFYLLLPLLIRFVPTRKLRFVLPLLILAAPVTRLVFYFTEPNWTVSGYVLMLARADALMLGVLAACCIRSGRALALLKRWPSAPVALVSATGLALLVMALRRENFSKPGMVIYGFSLLALFYTGLLWLSVTADESSVLRVVLRSRVLVRCGLLAYGLYLFHTPLVGMSAWMIDSPALAQMTGLALTFFIAALSWKYFEKPFVKKGHSHLY